MTFCQSKDLSAQYIKSVSVFLKPKPSTKSADQILLDDASGSELNSKIDPVGLLIFGEDMNDEQRISLFTDMTEKLYVKSQMESNYLDLAKTTMQIIELITNAGFQNSDSKKRI
jgi:hypothetical protein